MQQSRYDLEFLGRMLGLRPGVDYEPIRDAPDVGLIRGPHLPPVETSVARATRDPVANARARQRIGDLFAQCERVLVAYSRIDDDCFRCGRPFRWPAGVDCGDGRHAPPFTREESARIRASYFGDHSPEHFTRPN